VYSILGLGWVLVPGWMLARLMFSPQYVHGAEDETVARVNWVRAALGLLIAAVVWVVYSNVGFWEAIFRAVAGYLLSALLVLPPFLALVAVLVLAARRRREALQRMLSGPLLSVLLMLLAGGSVVGATEVVNLEQRLRELEPRVLLPYVMLQVALLVVGGIYYMWVHGFRAIDGNPLLRPLVTPLFVWANALLNLVLEENFEQWYGVSGVPAWLALTTSFGGAILVTAMAVWEYRHVSQLMGISFRSGPPPPKPRGETIWDY
jgi:hypothetical protein